MLELTQAFRDLYTYCCIAIDFYWSKKLLTLYLHQSKEGHVLCLELNNNLPTILNRIIYSYTIYDHETTLKRPVEGKFKCGGQRIYSMPYEDAWDEYTPRKIYVPGAMYDNYWPKFAKRSKQKTISRLETPILDNDLIHPRFDPSPRSYNSWETGPPE